MPSAAASPSPRPVNLVVKNGSKILAFVSSAMPQPVLCRANLDERVTSWDERRGTDEVSGMHRVHVLHSRRHENGATVVSHGFRSVDHEVHDQLLNLRDVDFDGGEANAKLETKVNRARQRGLEQMSDLADVLGKVDRTDLEKASAGVRQELPRQIGGTARGGDDVPDGGGCRARRRKQPLCCRCAAEDTREQIVEVVCDPARENSEALGLLDLKKLRLQPGTFAFRAAALGDVRRDADDALDTSSRVEERPKHGLE